MEMAKQNKHKECSYYHSREVELFVCPSSLVFVCHRSLFWMRNPKAALCNFKHTVTQPRVVTEGLKVYLPCVFYNIMLQIKHLCPSETRLFGVCWFFESNWSLLVSAFCLQRKRERGKERKETKLHIKQRYERAAMRARPRWRRLPFGFTSRPRCKNLITLNKNYDFETWLIFADHWRWRAKTRFILETPRTHSFLWSCSVWVYLIQISQVH